jgi:hypothetical protein
MVNFYGLKKIAFLNLQPLVYCPQIKSFYHYFS